MLQVGFSVLSGALWLLGSARAKAQTADHTTLDVASIPQTALDSARSQRMSLDHASVGGNIKQGMDGLQSADGARYSYPNWYWHSRGNPGWQAKVDQFVQWVNTNAASYDVFMMKFCYIDQAADFAYYRDQMLALESQHASKTFVWWTMPLMTSADAQRNSFNASVRSYAAANNKPLYDIADIESHDPSGALVDQSGEAMFADYSSDGGHLTAAGEERAARALWWLMSRISGWAPDPAAGDGGAGSLATGGRASGTGGSSSRAGSSAAGAAPASTDDGGGCNLSGHRSSRWLGLGAILGSLMLIGRNRCPPRRRRTRSLREDGAYYKLIQGGRRNPQRPRSDDGCRLDLRPDTLQRSPRR
jgi:hypothetical protein